MRNNMAKASVLLIALLASTTTTSLTSSQEAQTIRHPETKKELKLFPHTCDRLPSLPSPYTLDDGTEIVVALTQDDKYILIPVTIENGKPLNL